MHTRSPGSCAVRGAMARPVILWPTALGPRVDRTELRVEYVSVCGRPGTPRTGPGQRAAFRPPPGSFASPNLAGAEEVEEDADVGADHDLRALRVEGERGHCNIGVRDLVDGARRRLPHVPQAHDAVEAARHKVQIPPLSVHPPSACKPPAPRRALLSVGGKRPYRRIKAHGRDRDVGRVGKDLECLRLVEPEPVFCERRAWLWQSAWCAVPTTPQATRTDRTVPSSDADSRKLCCAVDARTTHNEHVWVVLAAASP